MGLEMDNMACDLTEQELDILRLVAAGKSNQEIAGVVAMSERHVRRILRRIYDKLGVNTRAEAAFQAGVLGLVT